MPSQSWDEAPEPDFDKEVQQGGYCAHNIVSFPTWHRPYLLLYEVRIPKSTICSLQANELLQSNVFGRL